MKALTAAAAQKAFEDEATAARLRQESRAMEGALESVSQSIRQSVSSVARQPGSQLASQPTNQTVTIIRSSVMITFFGF